MKAIDHFISVDQAARVDLARELRACATRMAREAELIESGSSPNTHSPRADIREVELALLAYDKAKAALEAARCCAAEG